MPEFKQTERVVRILQRLSLRSRITVRELYEYFERRVPMRTLQRDLRLLSNANIPLQTREGEGHELIWYLEPSFLRFVPETLGSRELLASYFLERLAMITKGTKLQKDIESLMKKARQLVSPELFQSDEHLDLSPQLFGATFTGYIDYSPFSDTIDRILDAAAAHHRCVFTYRRAWRQQPSEFEADPYMILFHKGALYTVVYVPAHDNYIFLAIQRIKEARITETTFVRDRSFSLAKLRADRFGIFGHPQLKPRKVTLTFDRDIADVVAERTWHPTQKLTRHRDGSLTLTMTTVISDELRSWIAGWLGRVKVVAPKSLVREMEGRDSQ